MGTYPPSPPSCEELGFYHISVTICESDGYKSTLTRVTQSEALDQQKGGR